MKRTLGTIIVGLGVACAGTTIIAPEIEIKKDGTVKIAFQATVTKTASTSTTAYGKPGGTGSE